MNGTKQYRGYTLALMDDEYRLDGWVRVKDPAGLRGGFAPSDKNAKYMVDRWIAKDNS